jgi:hypothetical protein
VNVGCSFGSLRHYTGFCSNFAIWFVATRLMKT